MNDRQSIYKGYRSSCGVVQYYRYMTGIMDDYRYMGRVIYRHRCSGRIEDWNGCTTGIIHRDQLPNGVINDGCIVGKYDRSAYNPRWYTCCQEKHDRP